MANVAGKSGAIGQEKEAMIQNTAWVPPPHPADNSNAALKAYSQIPEVVPAGQFNLSAKPHEFQSHQMPGYPPVQPAGIEMDGSHAFHTHVPQAGPYYAELPSGGATVTEIGGQERHELQANYR